MREERRSTTQSKRSREDGGWSVEESLGRRQNAIQHQSPGRQRSLYERGKQEFCAKPSSELNYSFLGSSSWPPPRNRSVSGANVMSRDIFLLGKENFVSREFKLFQPLWFFLSKYIFILILQGKFFELSFFISLHTFITFFCWKCDTCFDKTEH